MGVGGLTYYKFFSHIDLKYLVLYLTNGLHQSIGSSHRYSSRLSYNKI